MNVILLLLMEEKHFFRPLEKWRAPRKASVMALPFYGLLQRTLVAQSTPTDFPKAAAMVPSPAQRGELARS